MEIRKSIDIEDAVRVILADYLTAYCRPLPKNFTVPSVLIQQVGGEAVTDWSGEKVLDTFDITLDSRADREAAALDQLNTAIGILIKASANQNTDIRRVEVNTMGSWVSDPVRPELAMCSARLRVKARPKIEIIN